MNPSPASSFQFNSLLDVQFLEELFEGDIEYAATVFGDFLQDLPMYWLEVETAFRNEDKFGLRSAAHKCKTLFGYVGHSQVLESLQTFERQCEAKGNFDQIRKEYLELVQLKESAEMLIRSEHQRLLDYCK